MRPCTGIVELGETGRYHDKRVDARRAGVCDDVWHLARRDRDEGEVDRARRLPG